MDKLLSIVIPSYNAEKFLDNILGNLLVCQSLDQLDILIIDDGSTDKTALVANKYVTAYPASIRLISKKMAGMVQPLIRELSMPQGDISKWSMQMIG